MGLQGRMTYTGQRQGRCACVDRLGWEVYNRSTEEVVDFDKAFDEAMYGYLHNSHFPHVV